MIASREWNRSTSPPARAALCPQKSALRPAVRSTPAARAYTPLPCRDPLCYPFSFSRLSSHFSRIFPLARSDDLDALPLLQFTQRNQPSTSAGSATILSLSHEDPPAAERQTPIPLINPAAPISYYVRL